MGYVAVTGGQEAIEASIELLKEYRSEGGTPLDIGAVRDRMGLLIDRIMSEAGLYAPDYAALALKQCEGSPEEAVFLLRAYRSTLPRNYTSRTVKGDDMHIRRRISAAFKDIPGGQMLGLKLASDWPVFSPVFRSAVAGLVFGGLALSLTWNPSGPAVRKGERISEGILLAGLLAVSPPMGGQDSLLWRLLSGAILIAFLYGTGKRR